MSNTTTKKWFYFPDFNLSFEAENHEQALELLNEYLENEKTTEKTVTKKTK
jgi:hypothetical protein